MNDLTFINNLESSQLNGPYKATYVSPRSSAEPGTNSSDSYARDPGTSCSVHAVDSGSTFGLWRLIFKLFGSD